MTDQKRIADKLRHIHKELKRGDYGKNDRLDLSALAASLKSVLADIDRIRTKDHAPA